MDSGYDPSRFTIEPVLFPIYPTNNPSGLTQAAPSLRGMNKCIITRRPPASGRCPARAIYIPWWRHRAIRATFHREQRKCAVIHNDQVQFHSQFHCGSQHTPYPLVSTFSHAQQKRSPFCCKKQPPPGSSCFC